MKKKSGKEIFEYYLNRARDYSMQIQDEGTGGKGNVKLASGVALLGVGEGAT